MLGQSLPHWLITPGPVLLRNHVRNKGDPLCYEVDLLESNQQFAQVRFPDGRESTVSTKDLAPYPSTKEPTRISHEEQPSSPNSLDPPDQSLDNINLTPPDNPHPSSPLPLPYPQPSQTSPTPLSLPFPQPLKHQHYLYQVLDVLRELAKYLTVMVTECVIKMYRVL